MLRSERWLYPRWGFDPPAEVGEPRRPLQLCELRAWDPAEKYSDESSDVIEVSAVEVIVAGSRPQFMPGAKPRRSLAIGPAQASQRRFCTAVAIRKCALQMAVLLRLVQLDSGR